ncbi:MAG: uncharacterized protein A8A55_3010 [Amphiamblys sp. WSBS2006]|nr:MAG: uncharacterized protein A8A55_3010 [Amphiamblys sp. WSBS2006]
MVAACVYSQAMPQTGPWGRETGPGELDPLPGFQKHHGGQVYENAEPIRARLELMNLRDNGDLEEYLEKAQNMESRIPNLSEAGEMVALVNGLAPGEKDTGTNLIKHKKVYPSLFYIIDRQNKCSPCPRSRVRVPVWP